MLPYRETDQSGVLFTALAFGKPLLLSDVGGFPEVAATGAARTFPAGDAAALHTALRELLADPTALSAMAERARAAADGPYSWDEIARRTLELYGSLRSPTMHPKPTVRVIEMVDAAASQCPCRLGVPRSYDHRRKAGLASNVRCNQRRAIAGSRCEVIDR